MEILPAKSVVEIRDPGILVDRAEATLQASVSVVIGKDQAFNFKAKDKLS